MRTVVCSMLSGQSMNNRLQGRSFFSEMPSIFGVESVKPTVKQVKSFVLEHASRFDSGNMERNPQPVSSEMPTPEPEVSNYPHNLP